VLCRMDGEAVGIACADISMSVLDEVRARMPVMAHQRADIYGDAFSPPAPVSVVRGTL